MSVTHNEKINKFGINWEIKCHISPASNESSFEQSLHCTSPALYESSVDQVAHRILSLYSDSKSHLLGVRGSS